MLVQGRLPRWLAPRTSGSIRGFVVAQSEAGQKKLVAGLLGILIGSLGIHRFYLGDSTGGIIRIVISFCTLGLGGIIGFIEGIIYITKSDEDFERIYLKEGKKWF